MKKNLIEVKNLEKYFEIEIIEGDYGEGYWNYLCRRKKNKKDA